MALPLTVSPTDRVAVKVGEAEWVGTVHARDLSNVWVVFHHWDGSGTRRDTKPLKVRYESIVAVNGERIDC